MSRAALCLACLVTLLARPVAAAELRLEIAGGFVTLVAVDAPLRQILAEWAKVGGTRIVNGERVTGPPVTLQLERIPEQQALAILLRSVAGYLAAPRRAGASGASQYESVMILATSTPPAASAAPAAAARGPVNPLARPVPNPIDMLNQQQQIAEGGDQVPSNGFITVGSAPAPRPQTPATGATATPTKPMGSPFTQVPVAGRPGPNPPPPPAPTPTTVQPGILTDTEP